MVTKKLVLTLGIPVFMMASNASCCGSSAPSSTTSTPSGSIEGVEEDKEEYQELEIEDVGTVENHFYLILTEDKSKDNVGRIATEIKNKCNKPCNVSIYDDKKAYELDRDYSAITSVEEGEEWKKNNYIFVADHFVGYLGFEDSIGFYYYMYKDWYYEELKNASSEINNKPEWYGKEYKVTTVEEGYDVGTIQVWPSYEDRSEVLFQFKNNDTITLIGYYSDYDYCKVLKDSKEGWVACAWIVGLPADMTDYWEL